MRSPSSATTERTVEVAPTPSSTSTPTTAPATTTTPSPMTAVIHAPDRRSEDPITGSTPPDSRWFPAWPERSADTDVPGAVPHLTYGRPWRERQGGT